MTLLSFLDTPMFELNIQALVSHFSLKYLV